MQRGQAEETALMPFPARAGRKWSTIPRSYVDKFLSYNFQQSETTELATHLDGVEEDRVSSAYNTEQQHIHQVVYIVSEDILNIEIEVRNFNIADLGLEHSTQSFRERIF